MQKFMTSFAAALCLLLAAPPAMAQRDHHDRDRHERHHGGWDRAHHDRSGRDLRWGHSRHDWSRYRHSGSSHRRFHRGSFHWPRGYHYRRWAYGEFLPRIFFATNYWLNDWRVYGLYAPPPGLVWVRHGPDALLVDRYTGEIVRVNYNVFF
jgi:Ni/Co efflux regulator RcnB